MTEISSLHVCVCERVSEKHVKEPEFICVSKCFQREKNRRLIMCSCVISKFLQVTPLIIMFYFSHVHAL